MMKRSLLIAVVLVALPVTAQTKKVKTIPLTWKGVAIGAPAASPQAFNGGDGLDCDAKNEAENFQWCRDRVELNEDTTLQGDLQMSDGRFEYLLGTFDSDSWSFIRSTFVEKYGPPTSVDTEPVQNGMGAKFMNEELLWMRPEGALILKKYFSDLTKGVYMMRSTARIQREEARSNEEKRKATKKF